jgi:uncharacterized glyoxalase superfamily protein PhnB
MIWIQYLDSEAGRGATLFLGEDSVKLNQLVPILWVNDIEETIAFYRNALGFECRESMEDWACLANNGVELMISLPNQHEPFEKLQFTGSFYFRPDDVDQLWEQLKDRAPVVYPVENFDYGMREFAIRDNTGYILQFGRAIE